MGDEEGAPPAVEEVPAEAPPADAPAEEAPPAEGEDAPPAEEGEAAPPAEEGDPSPPAEGGEEPPPAEGEGGKPAPEGSMEVPPSEEPSGMVAPSEEGEMPPSEEGGEGGEGAMPEDGDVSAEPSMEEGGEGEPQGDQDMGEDARMSEEMQEGEDGQMGDQEMSEEPSADVGQSEENMSQEPSGEVGMTDEGSMEQMDQDGIYTGDGEGEGPTEEEMQMMMAQQMQMQQQQQYMDEQNEEYYDEQGMMEDPSFESFAPKLQELYEVALTERKRLTETNLVLQRKIAASLKDKQKTVAEQGEEQQASRHTDAEGKYQKVLLQLHEYHEEFSKVQAQNDRIAMEMKAKLEEKDHKGREIASSFLEFKREISLGAENSRTGKAIPVSVIEKFEEMEQKKDQEVEVVRLKNINYRNTLKKLEGKLKQKEELADGLHLIDFEQLKIENQTLNEKIEERNEELLKLRKKTTTTVQVLTHLKEKLQFVQAENQVLKRQLADLETELTKHRDALTRVKHDRDNLRQENTRIKQRAGLVNSDMLMRDFEKRKYDVQKMRDELQGLKDRHAQLTDLITRSKDIQYAANPPIPGTY